MRWKLRLFGLCDGDFGIPPVDDIIIGIICVAFCFHIAHRSVDSPWYLFCVWVIVFGEIIFIRDSYVYQKAVLCFFIRESFVRTVTRYRLVCNYAAVPVQLEIVILQYTGWSVLIVETLSSNSSAASASF
jgi:hypothetical protein